MNVNNIVLLIVFPYGLRNFDGKFRSINCTSLSNCQCIAQYLLNSFSIKSRLDLPTDQKVCGLRRETVCSEVYLSSERSGSQITMPVCDLLKFYKTRKRWIFHG